MITPDRLTEIRHIAPTAGPLGQAAINELLAEVERLFLEVVKADGQIKDQIAETLAAIGETEGLTRELDELRRNGAGTVQQLRTELAETRTTPCDRCSRPILPYNPAGGINVCGPCGRAASDDVHAEEVEFYSNCYDAAREALAETNAKLDRSRAELADLHNVEADLRAQLADLQRRQQEADDSIEWMDARCNGRQPLTRKDCCGAPWDAPHRGTCEEAK